MEGTEFMQHPQSDPIVPLMNPDPRAGKIDFTGFVQHPISSTPGRERPQRYSLDSLAVNCKFIKQISQ
jgi:hypothetical protein